MKGLGSVLSAFGLSASSGLNAYIPLLIVSLMARFTNWVPLSEPWDALSSWWVIGALAILTLIEFFADKFPAVDHANDILQTFGRTAAGAVLFAASTGTATQIHPVVAIIAGLLVAERARHEGARHPAGGDGNDRRHRQPAGEHPGRSGG